MPDLDAILALYRLRAMVAVTGASRNESADLSEEALVRVSLGFLSKDETGDWEHLGEDARAARTRVGRQRFHRWEMTNPDVASLLRRKGRSMALR